MSDGIIQNNEYKDWAEFIVNKIKQAQTQTDSKSMQNY